MFSQNVYHSSQSVFMFVGILLWLRERENSPPRTGGGGSNFYTLHDRISWLGVRVVLELGCPRGWMAFGSIKKNARHPKKKWRLYSALLLTL